ncbi:hypothetical protein N6H14_28100 [Paenibacillus sp. CC-CFT747]|nr:hypothetical protein N6H14_28100 [Paenibacillus sp. CC-CFT747]
MGHLQQCVMQDEYDQLVDDILIAKLANLNFYRLTQRPVQEEIYDYMDRLGMLNQCDLPAFGYIRRSQFCEAVRQSAEMERLVRSHPCVILVSLINEPSRPAKRGKGHRHLYRDEMEAFFTAARQAIYIENPDRIVKNADGDYDPPTSEGLSDFHCYTMWYTNHMIPFGELYKGGLPPLKTGWKTGCGEYGSEGLDRLKLMQSRYPKEWLPEKLTDPWMPNAIVDAQSYALHGDWYPEPNRIEDWIRESQSYQAHVTRLMTDTIRRRSDRIVQSAIHLLIDAWPSGWMKALVGVDRIPKPAYFAYRESLEPIRVNLRGDRWRAYAGESIELETWLLNDSAEEVNGARLLVTLRDETTDYATYELEVNMEAAASRYAGSVSLQMPQSSGRKRVYAEASLLNASGQLLNGERFEIEVFEKAAPAGEGVRIAHLGAQAQQVCRDMGLKSRPYSAGDEFDTLLVSSSEAFRVHESEVSQRIKAGAQAVFLADEDGSASWSVGETEIHREKAGGVFTVSFQAQDPSREGLDSSDFRYFYNRTTDRIEPLAGCAWRTEGLAPLLYTYGKPPHGSQPSVEGKPKLAVVGSLKLGQGRAVFIGLLLQGRLGVNPPLDSLLAGILSGARREADANR